MWSMIWIVRSVTFMTCQLPWHADMPRAYSRVDEWIMPSVELDSFRSSSKPPTTCHLPSHYYRRTSNGTPLYSHWRSDQLTVETAIEETMTACSWKEITFHMLHLHKWSDQWLSHGWMISVSDPTNHQHVLQTWSPQALPSYDWPALSMQKYSLQ